MLQIPALRSIDSLASLQLLMRLEEETMESTQSSTSNQSFHSDEIGQFVDHDWTSRNKTKKRKIARERLAAAVIANVLPPSIVEYEGFRALVKYISPDIPCFSRNTIVSDINKLYLKEKVKLEQVLANIPSRVCLTVDVWSARTNECYICLAARFVDENWKMNCKILNFDRVDSPDIEGVDLATKIGDFLMEWGIYGKVFSLTSSRNDTMQDILKKRLLLDNNLLCGGDFFHGRCLADTLNLIVQNGLQLCADVLVKIRESVKYVSCTKSRRKRFADCVSQFSEIDTSVELRLDVCTSWNYTYSMLDSAIKYKKAFASFRLLEQDYDQVCPTDEEWNRGEKLREFLKPYNEIQHLFCDSSRTSNVYFVKVWTIEKLLKENSSNEDAMISELCGSVVEKFNKYWNEYSMVLAFGVILDPRFKLYAFECAYSKVESDSSKCREKSSLVKSKLYELFEEYKNVSKPSSPQLQSSSFSPSFHDIFLAEYMEHERQRIELLNAGKSQLDLYFEGSRLSHLRGEDLNLLEYWKSETDRWPDLALMACDVLAFPVTTIASESGFSIGARLLTKYKSYKIPRNIQDLICTRSWLHGFASNDDDDLMIV